ncbi:MAG: undecaprenyl/decaprenyl-phosphate alpha-N-acetylglucosaminyl 1-phosphate transferase [Clostridiales bacterium]|jgi:UDP-GlcNAc:undecaprenyl-phosphate GlcNAc-1-phosphate transferase|nr:undecaprenyl/decaprenyl-phosphate alpha-N-acetylglucosaminyl 1-phosphate transferase [Clostridiales bacterium]
MEQSITKDWFLYLIAFFSAFAISLLSTPFAKRTAIKLGAIDKPRERGMHKRPIPRMGGIAIIMGFIGTMLALCPFLPELHTMQFVGFLLGAVIISAAGVIDDTRGLKPLQKLVFQFAAAGVVVATGSRLNISGWHFLEYFSVPVTFFWIIGITNAVNLIDGVDGLAAGVSSIAALSLMVLCIVTGTHLAVVLTAALAGTCLGFLPRNFSPAEVIMGDTGALFLGYVLSVCSIIGVFKSYALLAMVISVFCLALPVFDTLFAILRRIYNHRPISEADRGHLHHRLIDSGFSHRGAVSILYALSVLSGGVAIVISLRDMRAFAVMIVFLAVFLIMLASYKGRIDAEKKEKEEDGKE